MAERTKTRFWAHTMRAKMDLEHTPPIMYPFYRCLKIRLLDQLGEFWPTYPQTIFKRFLRRTWLFSVILTLVPKPYTSSFTLFQFLVPPLSDSRPNLQDFWNKSYASLRGVVKNLKTFSINRIRSNSPLRIFLDSRWRIWPREVFSMHDWGSARRFTRKFQFCRLYWWTLVPGNWLWPSIF